jgi:hypothetical protein
MKNATWDALKAGMKVPRIRVYAMLIKALCGLAARDEN